MHPLQKGCVLTLFHWATTVNISALKNRIMSFPNKYGNSQLLETWIMQDELYGARGGVGSIKSIRNFQLYQQQEQRSCFASSASSVCKSPVGFCCEETPWPSLCFVLGSEKQVFNLSRSKWTVGFRFPTQPWILHSRRTEMTFWLISRNDRTECVGNLLKIETKRPCRLWVTGRSPQMWTETDRSRHVRLHLVNIPPT